MALKKPLHIILFGVAIVVGMLFFISLSQLREASAFNAALDEERYGDAASFENNHGKFTQAYLAQQNGDYQAARVLYAELEDASDLRLRIAAVFNMGNTYLQQAAAIDVDKDRDIALPLLELAKLSYREVLALDSEHWDARYNLERTLRILPDPLPDPRIEVIGRRRTVRTVRTPDPEESLP